MPSTALPIAANPAHPGADSITVVFLRLYVAGATPNSVRAEANLTAALAVLGSKFGMPALEVIDVFLQPKRAMRDGVIVTPTLIGIGDGKRVVLMGDLADPAHLGGVLASLLK